VQLEQLPTEWHCQRCEPFPQWFPNLEIKIVQEIEHFAVLQVKKIKEYKSRDTQRLAWLFNSN
jgi:hypothetical protein